MVASTQCGRPATQSLALDGWYSSTNPGSRDDHSRKIGSSAAACWLTGMMSATRAVSTANNRTGLMQCIVRPLAVLAKIMVATAYPYHSTTVLAAHFGEIHAPPGVPCLSP